jgi:FtsP/CotA-like multicopper oxidase with cupredoxin domain
MNVWESRVAIPDVNIANYQLGNNARYFKIIVEPIEHNILSNVTIEALGYNGSTPGPLIIVKQGEVDGFPRKEMMHDTISVASGQRWDVEFVANNPGIWPINGTKSFHQ